MAVRRHRSRISVQSQLTACQVFQEPRPLGCLGVRKNLERFLEVLKRRTECSLVHENAARKKVIETAGPSVLQFLVQLDRTLEIAEGLLVVAKFERCSRHSSQRGCRDLSVLLRYGLFEGFLECLESFGVLAFLCQSPGLFESPESDLGPFRRLDPCGCRFFGFGPFLGSLGLCLLHLFLLLTLFPLAPCFVSRLLRRGRTLLAGRLHGNPFR